jgi:hypothetical protein
MEDKLKLQQEILSTESPDRSLVVKYLQAIAVVIRQESIETLAVKPLAQPPRKFPANQAEEFASDITMLIQFDLIDQDEKLDHICSLGSQLEIHPEDKTLWRDLLESIDSLK